MDKTFIEFNFYISFAMLPIPSSVISLTLKFDKGDLNTF